MVAGSFFPVPALQQQQQPPTVEEEVEQGCHRWREEATGNILTTTVKLLAVTGNVLAATGKLLAVTGNVLASTGSVLAATDSHYICPVLIDPPQCCDLPTDRMEQAFLFGFPYSAALWTNMPILFRDLSLRL